MPEYRVRPATLDDADALVRHRTGMFTDMGFALEAPAHESAFRTWLAETMPAGLYRGWVVEDGNSAIVGGGGITVIPWPPGPQHPGGHVAFVYNVYTEPAHRRRGATDHGRRPYVVSNRRHRIGGAKCERRRAAGLRGDGLSADSESDDVPDVVAAGRANAGTLRLGRGLGFGFWLGR